MNLGGVIPACLLPFDAELEIDPVTESERADLRRAPVTAELLPVAA